MPGLVDDTAIDEAVIEQAVQGEHCICGNSRDSLNDFYQQTIKGLSKNGERYLKQQQRQKKGTVRIYPSAKKGYLFGDNGYDSYIFSKTCKIQGRIVSHDIGYELDIREAGTGMQQVIVVIRQVTCTIHGSGTVCFRYPKLNIRGL